MVIIFFRAVTLEGAGVGLKFLFIPEVCELVIHVEHLRCDGHLVSREQNFFKKIWLALRINLISYSFEVSISATDKPVIIGLLFQ